MGEKYTVLVVEDHRANTFLYQKLLAYSLDCGFSFMFLVECVDRLSLALARLAAHNGVDVVLLDLGLSDAVGFEALDQIAAISKVPVIVITGSVDSINAARALERGAQAFYFKPLVSTPEQFIHGVWSAIHRQKYVNLLQVQKETATEVAESKPGLSRATVAGITAAILTALTALVAGIAELVKAWRSK